MEITQSEKCPDCVKAGRLDVHLVQDTDIVPVQYTCQYGHKFDSLPGTDLTPEPETIQLTRSAHDDPPPRPFAEITAELQEKEKTVELMPVMVPVARDPQPAAVTVESLREAMRKKIERQRGAVAVDLAALYQSGPVHLPGGDLLIAVRLPERVVLDLQGEAEARKMDIRTYFETLLQAAYDLELFINLVPTA